MEAHWRAPAGLHVASARLPVEGELPSFGGAAGWLNSEPLTPAGLRGKVVLAGFWTYTCNNWLRQLPYLRAWAGKYSGHGLVVIGTPVRFRVLLDRQPPAEARGTDADGDGNGTVTQQRVYQLLRQPGLITGRTFEITFPDPGAQAYCFTFG
jgi:thiol-disulfide isomerase/thioredoxin